MLAILAPYGRNEVTAAALRLADLAAAAGLPVRLAALGVCERGVHPSWDAAVLRDPAAAWRDAEHCVWFAGSERQLAAARRLAAPGAAHTLVPSWHNLRREDLPLLRSYDGLVCPSPHVAAALDRALGREGCGWVNWHAPAPAGRGAGGGGRRLLWHCDAASIDECPLIALAAVDNLLDEFPDARVTLASLKSWARRDRARLRRLAANWGERLTLVNGPSQAEQLDLLHGHDWLVLPAVRADFGVAALRGLACGVPVVCYRVPPLSDAVRDGLNGVLVPCEIVGGPLGAQVAAANSTHLLEGCRAALADRGLAGRLRDQDWGDGGAAQFRDYWLDLFGLPTQ